MRLLLKRGGRGSSSRTKGLSYVACSTVSNLAMWYGQLGGVSDPDMMPDATPWFFCLLLDTSWRGKDHRSECYSWPFLTLQNAPSPAPWIHNESPYHCRMMHILCFCCNTGRLLRVLDIEHIWKSCKELGIEDCRNLASSRVHQLHSKAINIFCLQQLMPHLAFSSLDLFFAVNSGFSLSCQAMMNASRSSHLRLANVSRICSNNKIVFEWGEQLYNGLETHLDSLFLYTSKFFLWKKTVNF